MDEKALESFVHSSSATEIDLEKIYEMALSAEKSGDIEKATGYYQQMLILDAQDHGGAAVRLAALNRGPIPEGASPAYVTTLFDQHAEVFDLILVDELHYDVPHQLRECLEELTGGRIFERFLDLGCGTGLGAEALDEITGHATGVDLAENMIAIAHEKGDYDQLFVGDIVQFLARAENEHWDLIAATDVLPYMGNLEPFFAKANHHLEQEGFFAFSSEVLTIEQFAGQSYKVGPFHRFAHQPDYIEICLTKAGLKLMVKKDIVVRQEQGEDVAGQLFIAMKTKKYEQMINDKKDG